MASGRTTCSPARSRWARVPDAMIRELTDALQQGGPAFAITGCHVDVIGGHVVFDYDTSRELAGALTTGMKIPRTAMV